MLCNPIHVNKLLPGPYFGTLLTHAVKKKITSFVEVLVEHGADVNLINPSMPSAVHLPIIDLDVPTLRLLLRPETEVVPGIVFLFSYYCAFVFIFFVCFFSGKFGPKNQGVSTPLHVLINLWKPTKMEKCTNKRRTFVCV